MGSRNAEHEAFVRRVLAEVSALRDMGSSDYAALAVILNARGMMSRRGRPWTAVTLEKAPLKILLFRASSI